MLVDKAEGVRSEVFAGCASEQSQQPAQLLVSAWRDQASLVSGTS